MKGDLWFIVIKIGTIPGTFLSKINPQNDNLNHPEYEDSTLIVLLQWATETIYLN